MVLRLFLVFAIFFCVSPVSTTQLRPRRSLAPFLGAGGSKPGVMGVTWDHWHCGSDEYSRNISYNEVSTNCPSLGGAVNHCCAVHDDCYGQQSGQEDCDRQFCECNRIATRLPTEEGFKCRAHLEDACTILGWFGHFAYGDSNYTDPTKPSNVVPVVPKSVPSMADDYLHLYSKCPYVNITLASCSYNFDLCADVHSVDFCANDLCHCILDAAESEPLHRKNCTEAVTHTCRIALKHSSAILVVNDNTKLSLLLFLFLCTASLVGGVSFVIWSRYVKQQTKEDGKYDHIHTVESSRSVNPLLLNAD